MFAVNAHDCGVTKTRVLLETIFFMMSLLDPQWDSIIIRGLHGIELRGVNH